MRVGTKGTSWIKDDFYFPSLGLELPIFQSESHFLRCEGQVRASQTQTAQWTTWVTSPQWRPGPERRQGQSQQRATLTSWMVTVTWPAQFPTSPNSPTWAAPPTPVTSQTWAPDPLWTSGTFRKILYDAPSSCLMARLTEKDASMLWFMATSNIVNICLCSKKNV